MPTAKPQDSPREAFLKVCQGPNGRVGKVMDSLHRLSKLNSPRYEYTLQEVEKIQEALQHDLDKCIWKLKEHRK